MVEASECNEGGTQLQVCMGNSKIIHSMGKSTFR